MTLSKWTISNIHNSLIDCMRTNKIEKEWFKVYMWLDVIFLFFTKYNEKHNVYVIAFPRLDVNEIPDVWDDMSGKK